MGYSIICLCVLLLAYNVSGDKYQYLKPGARTVINMEKPDGASTIESCNAQKYIYENNTLIESNELLDFYDTRVHFVAEDNCTFEIVTVDYSTTDWQITTKYRSGLSDKIKSTMETIRVYTTSDWYAKNSFREPTLLAEVGGFVRVPVPGPVRGQKLDCYAIHYSPYRRTVYISTSYKEDTYERIPIFEIVRDSSCTMNLKILNKDMLGKWEFITTYIYRDDSRRQIKSNQSITYILRDSHVFSSYGKPDRVVSPDHDYIIQYGQAYHLTALVGKNLTLIPTPIPRNVTKYVDRCEALFITPDEDYIFEIAPNKDTRFPYNYRGMFSTCEYDFTSFQKSYEGIWNVSTFYEGWINGTKKKIRQDDMFVINVPS